MITGSKSSKTICKTLKLNKPKIIKGNFDRPNLYLSINQKNEYEMINLLNENKDEYIIIYCLSRKDTDILSSKITNLGIKIWWKETNYALDNLSK